jgi:uracil phosphoribosyltransferase
MEDNLKVLIDKLRDRTLDTALFRDYTEKIGILLANKYRHLFLDQTPPILIVILRAGAALLPSFLQSFPDSPVGFIGLQRDEKTKKAHKYYEKLPMISDKDHFLVLEPMLATGGSAISAVELLKEKGAKENKIHFISLLAAPIGISALENQFPTMAIDVVQVDQGLDQDKFIVPGLGDFGDRFFCSLP